MKETGDQRGGTSEVSQCTMSYCMFRSSIFLFDMWPCCNTGCWGLTDYDGDIPALIPEKYFLGLKYIPIKDHYLMDTLMQKKKKKIKNLPFFNF